jgi:hypothetical protein
LASSRWHSTFLFSNARKKLRLKQGNFLPSAQRIVYCMGTDQRNRSLMDMIRFFEFVYFLDFITMIAALIVPSLLLQLTDRKQGIPPDTACCFPLSAQPVSPSSRRSSFPSCSTKATQRFS